MNKTPKQIIEEIRNEFDYEIYDGETATEEILSEIIGKAVEWYDTDYDDGIDDDESEDSYVMKSCFSTKDNEYVIRIYYGDVTEKIGCVDVCYKPRN